MRETLRGIGLVPMDAACWVSWGEGITFLSSIGSPKIPHSNIDSLLLPFWFIACSWLLCLWCCRSGFVCSGLTYGIYKGGSPSMYVYCVVCYSGIAASCVKSVDLLSLCTPLHSCWWIRLPQVSLVDDSECPGSLLLMIQNVLDHSCWWIRMPQVTLVDESECPRSLLLIIQNVLGHSCWWFRMPQVTLVDDSECPRSLLLMIQNSSGLSAFFTTQSFFFAQFDVH